MNVRGLSNEGSNEGEYSSSISLALIISSLYEAEQCDVDMLVNEGKRGESVGGCKEPRTSLSLGFPYRPEKHDGLLAAAAACSKRA